MDFYRDGFHGETVFSYLHPDDAGLAVEWLLLIEDKVAYAVVDGMVMIVFDGLQRVGMVTHEDVGSCLYQHVSLQTLTGHRLEGVFASPVQ